MAAIHTVVAGALDRTADGFLILGQVSERLTARRTPWIPPPMTLLT